MLIACRLVCLLNQRNHTKSVYVAMATEADQYAQTYSTLNLICLIISSVFVVIVHLALCPWLYIPIFPKLVFVNVLDIWIPCCST